MAGGRVTHTRHMCCGMIFEFLFEGKFTHIILVGATSSSTSKWIEVKTLFLYQFTCQILALFCENENCIQKSKHPFLHPCQKGSVEDKWALCHCCSQASPPASGEQHHCGKSFYHEQQSEQLELMVHCWSGLHIGAFVIFKLIPFSSIGKTRKYIYFMTILLLQLHEVTSIPKYQ